MKILSLIRHAKSSWSDPHLPDRERPLNERGERDAPMMARWLGQQDFSPARLLVSPARRTIDTAEALRKGLRLKKRQLLPEERLYAADLDTLLRLVGELDDALDHVAFVGHNPGLSELASHLGKEPIENLPTGSVCSLVFESDTWAGIQPGSGSLLRLDFPRDVARKLARPGGEKGKSSPAEQERGRDALPALKARLEVQRQALVANEEGVRDDLGPDPLHDYRVAVRRTRSLLDQVRGVFPEPASKRFRKAFRELASASSSLRDLDVHLTEVESASRLLSDTLSPALGPYRQLLLEQRKKARSMLLGVLESPEYRTMLQDYAAFLCDDGEDPGGGGPPLGKVADRSLRRLAKRLLRDGAAIRRDPSPAAFHRLRKTCKKFRYQLEFFQTLYPQKVIAGLIHTLKELQDNLGAFQDAEVHQRILLDFDRRLAASSEIPPGTLKAMGQVAALFKERQEEARREFAKTYRGFSRLLASRKIAGLWSKTGRKPAPE